MFVDGALIDSLETTSTDCSYTFDVTLALVGEPIAFTAQDIGSLENSEATIVQITDTTGLDIEGLPHYIMTVSVTNNSASTPTATFDISEIRAASITIPIATASISEKSLSRPIDNGELSIVFATESSDGIFLYSQLVTGGTTPELFTTEALPSLPLGLYDTPSDATFFLDQNGTFYTLYRDGSYSTNFELSLVLLPSESGNTNLSYFNINPEGDYAIYVGDVLAEAALAPMLFGMSVGDIPIPCFIEDQTWVSQVLEVAFADADTILVIYQSMMDGTFHVYHFSLTQALQNMTDGSYSIEPEDVIITTNYLGGPVAGTDVAGNYYLLCAGDDGVINICRLASGALETIVDQGVDVVAGSVQFAYNPTYLLYSLDTDPVVSCYYIIESGETLCRLLGSHPIPLHGEEGELVGYISDVNGYPQIAIENPANVF